MPDLREAFQAQVAAIRAARAPRIEPGADPGELHKLRVAIRRLRALLKGGATAPHRCACAESLRAELRELGHAIGPARDADVLATYLRAATLGLDEDADVAEPGCRRGPRTGPPRGLRRCSSGARRTPGSSGCCRSSTRSAQTSCSATASLNGIVRTEGTQAPAGNARRRDRRGAPRRADRGEAGSLRGRGRRRDKDVVARAKRFQDVVGEHQDAVFAEERLRSLSEPATALVIGRLIERQRARRAAARADVPKAWRKLDKSLDVIRAAGGVIVRDGDVLIVHRPKYGDWSLPKGKCKRARATKPARSAKSRRRAGSPPPRARSRGVPLPRYGGPKVVRGFVMRR